MRPINRWLEPLLALAILIALAGAFVHLWIYGYLPQPFFYDPGDIWMDWFNTAYWARDKGAYDVWGSVYPPLTFVVMRIFGISACYVPGYAADPYARYCDWVGIAAFHLFFILNIILISWTFVKIDRKTALPRSIAVSAGLPMLFALERANPFIITITTIVLGFGPLVASARWRWINVGLAINFKIYLIAALAPQLLRRRWRWFEGALVATILIYIVTYIIQGNGTPFQLYENLSAEKAFAISNFLDIWFSTTYQPLVGLLNSDTLPITSLIGSRNVDILLIVLPALTRTAQIAILLSWIASWLRPEAVPMFRLTGLGASLAIISTETSGYSLAIGIFFAMMEKWQGFGRKWAILMAYILCIPADIATGRVGSNISFSFFANRSVMIEYLFVIGPLLRPLLFMSISFALACVTIRQVWDDIKTHGWRQRWRFRRDVPIMAGGGHPARSGEAGVRGLSRLDD